MPVCATPDCSRFQAAAKTWARAAGQAALSEAMRVRGFVGQEVAQVRGFVGQEAAHVGAFFQHAMHMGNGPMEQLKSTDVR